MSAFPLSCLDNDSNIKRQTNFIKNKSEFDLHGKYDIK